MPTVPPTSGNPPPTGPAEPDKTSSGNTPAPPAMSGGGGGDGMTAFMATFTPEQRKQFMDILSRNILREIDKASKRYIEELRKERARIEGAEE